MLKRVEPRHALYLGVAVVLVSMLGCEIGPESGAGLRLPNGDVVAGERAFAELGCRTCHSIGNEPDPDRGRDAGVVVVLGGTVPHIETHGELVTSIVNPSHGFPRRYAREDVTEGGDSKMTNFNQQMTVQQLIDLTAYLQSKYDLALNEIYDYPG